MSLVDLHLDLTTMTVERRQTTVELSSRKFQFLEYFLRHPQPVLTRAQIEQALWEWRSEPESNAIETLIRRLRNRLK